MRPALIFQVSIASADKLINIVLFVLRALYGFAW